MVVLGVVGVEGFDIDMPCYLYISVDMLFNILSPRDQADRASGGKTCRHRVRFCVSYLIVLIVFRFCTLFLDFILFKILHCLKVFKISDRILFYFKLFNIIT